MEIEEFKKIFRAWIDGEEIQWKNSDGEWLGVISFEKYCENRNHICLSISTNYRIKPKPIRERFNLEKYNELKAKGVEVKLRTQDGINNNVDEKVTILDTDFKYDKNPIILCKRRNNKGNDETMATNPDTGKNYFNASFCNLFMEYLSDNE